MAIIINEFEVTPVERPPEQSPLESAPAATETTQPGDLVDLVDLAQGLARLNERQMRLEAH